MLGFWFMVMPSCVICNICHFLGYIRRFVRLVVYFHVLTLVRSKTSYFVAVSAFAMFRLLVIPFFGRFPSAILGVFKP